MEMHLDPFINLIAEKEAHKPININSGVLSADLDLVRDSCYIVTADTAEGESSIHSKQLPVALSWIAYSPSKQEVKAVSVKVSEFAVQIRKSAKLDLI
jgi:hypothetical protein